MNRLTWLLLGAALGFASSAALAFQESKGGQGSVPQAAGSAEETPLKKPLDTTGTGTSIDPGKGGTEIRIPGLGKLGTLPKFDFGLELLYGVNEAKPSDQDRSLPEPDDTRIRGSIKHRF